MHECPDCSQACACDQDDLWTEDNSACRCDCEWARDQGWDDTGHYEEDEQPGCVLGAACLCPHEPHYPDECFDEEMARAYHEEEHLTWRQRIARRLAEALAAVSSWVGQ